MYENLIYEIKDGIRSASAREEELKTLNRKALISLVKSANPEMLDLSNIWKETENRWKYILNSKFKFKSLKGENNT